MLVPMLLAAFQKTKKDLPSMFYPVLPRSSDSLAVEMRAKSIPVPKSKAMAKAKAKAKGAPKPSEAESKAKAKPGPKKPAKK